MWNIYICVYTDKEIEDFFFFFLSVLSIYFHKRYFHDLLIISFLHLFLKEWFEILFDLSCEYFTRIYYVYVQRKQA